MLGVYIQWKSLSICLDSAVLAAVLLNERLSLTGKLGCGLCVLGSTVIVLNAPVERDIKSVDEITIMMATNHVFQLYALFVLSFCLVLIFHYAPRIGHTNVRRARWKRACLCVCVCDPLSLFYVSFMVLFRMGMICYAMCGRCLST